MTDARDSCKKCGGHLRKNVYGASDMCPECENITKGRPANVVELRKLLTKASAVNGFSWYFPWRVIPYDGKPIIAGAKSGNLFRGYIATWQEADLAVAAVNALPALLDEIERLREETER